jgi:hypothetical protein
MELLKNVFNCLPLGLRNMVSHLLVGKGMETFEGREKQE